MIKKIIFLIILIISTNTYRAAIANNIFYVDMDKIISTSKPGFLMIKKLNELDKKNISDFNEIENDIKNKEKNLLGKKNILSNEEYNKGVDELRLEIKNYRENRKKVAQNFNNLKIKNTNELLKSINPILSKYAEENSIDLILQKKNLVLGKSEFDITDKIIELINKETK
jgi:Skp family chaperone for outer membrane proteins